jgi:hypothetical protein
MILLLMACTTSDPEDTAGTECPSYSVTECADHAECGFINGRLLQDDGAGGQCVDFSVDGEPVGCLGVGMGCGDAETLAAPADDPDACTWFPSTCIPTGWVSCGDVADECPS